MRCKGQQILTRVYTALSHALGDVALLNVMLQSTPLKITALLHLWIIWVIAKLKRGFMKS